MISSALPRFEVPSGYRTMRVGEIVNENCIVFVNGLWHIAGKEIVNYKIDYEDKRFAIPYSCNMPEPDPEPNEMPDTWDLVLDDIEERNRMGIRKYGTPHQPFNGRNQLRDAYQETLDLIVYLRALIYEEEHRDAKAVSR